MVSEENQGSSPAVGVRPEARPSESVDSEQKLLESGEIGDLLAGVGELPGLRPGQVVRGLVVKITDDVVLVDIGRKSEAAIARSEFLTDDGRLTAQAGDAVDVWVEEFDEQEGTFTFSHKKAARLRTWEDLEQAFREQTNVKGRAVERTKGGLTVDVGVRAFLPASQADIRPLRNLDSLIGAEIVCKVIKLDKERNNAVVSRKLALEEEGNKKKAELLDRLHEGAELTGRVKNLTGYGAFVDLEGMDGLLHVTDLSWGRVGHPSEVIHAGQEVRVKVLKFDREKERISLGMKQLTPDPWEGVKSIYHPGDRAAGRVVSLTDYGAFVELEPGVEGLIHVSEMTWSRRLKHPSKLLKVGDRVEVSVLDVNPSQRRISLSLKQTLADPWEHIADRLAVGSTVQGRVRNLTDFGAFVEIEDGVDGLIHVSDASWKQVKHPSEVLKKGQKVEAVILSLDAAQRRISLGLKQLQPNIWEEFFAETQVGSVLTGKVARLAQFGAFVELRPGIEGLCHTSEMGEQYSPKGPNPLQVGSELPFRVIRLDAGEKKIGLSLKTDARKPEPAPAAPKASKPSTAQAPPPPPPTQMAEKMAQAIRAAEAAHATSPAMAPVGIEEPGTTAESPWAPGDVVKTETEAGAETTAGAAPVSAEGSGPVEAMAAIPAAAAEATSRDGEDGAGEGTPVLPVAEASPDTSTRSE
ncbi:MAG TPA: 30S ribosomal protein S1 [Terriglobia bacterium]|nr:30S ribosomal protein S1 [Terriglobia bacterium]